MLIKQNRKTRSPLIPMSSSANPKTYFSDIEFVMVLGSE